jgi:hypothetical protein
MSVVLVRSRLSDGLVQHASVILRNRGSTVSATVAVVPVPRASCLEPVADEHLRAEMDERDPVWLSIADVVVRAGPIHVRAPGCMLTAVMRDGREHVLTRDGQAIEVAAAGPPGMFASFVHTWMVSGRPIAWLSGASLRVSAGPWRTVHVNHVAAGRPAGF